MTKEVLDGTDAVMFSVEKASRKHSVEVVSIMKKVVERAEEFLEQNYIIMR